MCIRDRLMMIQFKLSGCLVIFLLLALSSSAINAAQTLDPNEQAIVSWSEANNENAIDLLETLVNINSGSLNKPGVAAVGAVLRSELDALGFDTRWIEQPEEMNRGGHLFASSNSGSGKKILLIGHLDTCRLYTSDAADDLTRVDLG